jgi:putative transcriptional regulator
MPMPLTKTILLRNNVLRHRLHHGMTQQELATLAGVSRQTILNIEYGRTHPSILLAYRIAAALNVPVTALFRL